MYFLFIDFDNIYLYIYKYIIIYIIYITLLYNNIYNIVIYIYIYIYIYICITIIINSRYAICTCVSTYDFEETKADPNSLNKIKELVNTSRHQSNVY